jgi:hypothetical protein
MIWPVPLNLPSSTNFGESLNSEIYSLSLITLLLFDNVKCYINWRPITLLIMSKQCPVCFLPLTRAGIKVTCSECGIKAHAECLEKCPIHSVMVASSLHKSQANQLKISSILIVCLRCLKNHPKNRIRCLFLPKLQETIFCPIKIIQATPENLKRDISSNTRMIENKEPEDSLGKRETPSN